LSVTPEIPIISKIKESAILNFISKGVHSDRRPLDSYRSIEIQVDVVPNADGSALVKLGSTQVLAGVKLEIGQPYPDAPNSGVLIVNAEYLPAASPSFEPGPPDENAIELARVIDRSLREPKVIAFDKLAIIPGKKVWIIWLDIYVLDHDGNLTDAASIASMAALATTKLPVVQVAESGEVKVDKTIRAGFLPINKYVATVSVYKIGDALVLDPNGEEETISSGRIIFAVTEDSNIGGIQKAGIEAFSEEEIEKALRMALAKGRELIELMKAKTSPHITATSK